MGDENDGAIPVVSWTLLHSILQLATHVAPRVLRHVRYFLDIVNFNKKTGVLFPLF
jgi:hypothetical protein